MSDQIAEWEQQLALRPRSIGVVETGAGADVAIHVRQRAQPWNDGGSRLSTVCFRRCSGSKLNGERSSRSRRLADR
ncbi:MAG: hypothetical protein R3B96_21310 [Pirellulaceae bacterium]